MRKSRCWINSCAAHTLRDRLVELRAGLLDDATPDLESWLQTLELMKMYDRWFSKEELQLPFAVQKDALAAIWSGLVAEAKTLLEQHMPRRTRGRWIWRRAGWSAWSRIRRASRSF
jgi:hypothetical protein